MSIEQKEKALRAKGELTINESLTREGFYLVSLHDANQCELATSEKTKVDDAIADIYRQVYGTHELPPRWWWDSEYKQNGWIKGSGYSE